MAEWSNFFVAEAGASAALAGLIFVGISINLNDLMRFPHLLLHAAGALTLLLVVLATSSLLLAPGQSLHTIGVELLLLGTVSWLLGTATGLASVRQAAVTYRRTSWIAVGMRQVATIPLIAGGVVVLTRGEGGLYWLVPGFVGSFVVALVDAWVILVEVHR